MPSAVTTYNTDTNTNYVWKLHVGTFESQFKAI